MEDAEWKKQIDSLHEPIREYYRIATGDPVKAPENPFDIKSTGELVHDPVLALGIATEVLRESADRQNIYILDEIAERLSRHLVLAFNRLWYEFDRSIVPPADEPQFRIKYKSYIQSYFLDGIVEILRRLLQYTSGDMKAFLFAKPLDSPTGYTEACRKYLCYCVKLLGNALKTALPDCMKLCIDWRMKFLELAGWLCEISKADRIGDWSDPIEKKKALKRLDSLAGEAKELTENVWDNLKWKITVENQMGRFIVRRDFENKIVNIASQESTFAWKMYEGFQPKATEIFEKLLEAYESCKDNPPWTPEPDGENWRQAFQAKGNNKGAADFFKDQIVTKMKDGDDTAHNKIKHWRIKPVASND